MTQTPAPLNAPPKPTWDPRDPVRPLLRPTIRIRLTLLYGGMFLIAGILLLAIIYLFTAQALRDSTSQLPFKVVSGTVQPTTDWCELPEKSTGEQLNNAVTMCLRHQSDLALDDLLRRSLFALLGLSIIAFAFGFAMAGRVLSRWAGSPGPPARWPDPISPAGSSWTARTTS